MLMEENREEHRREAALRRVASDPQKLKNLQLRHKREREVKRAMITRTTRDSQVSGWVWMGLGRARFSRPLWDNLDHYRGPDLLAIIDTSNRQHHYFVQ